MTVAAPEASNSPLDVPHVTLTITTVAPDFDGDADVDQDDFRHFQACLAGPEVSRSKTVRIEVRPHIRYDSI